MKSDTPTIILGVVILVVIALSVVLVADFTAARAEVSEPRFELKQLGRDAAGGGKDAFDTTRDAGSEAQQKTKDAVK